MNARRLMLLLLLPLSPVSMATTVTPKIIGGEDATGDYPWMAGLHEYIPETGKYYIKPFCGGSLIAPGWVVSAAHCFTSAGNGGALASYSPQVDELIIRLDSPDLNVDPEHDARRIIAHPDYGLADGSDDSDIVLIQLDRKVAFDTISLADSNIMNQLETSSLLDDVVEIIGWGAYDGEDFAVVRGEADGNQPDFLQSVRLDYLPFSDRRCSTAWGGLTENMICAWEPQPDADDTFGEDACFGDSGGPLLLPQNTSLSSGTTTSPWLLGATSFGSTACDSSTTPGIYTRLANFENWIEDTTANAGDALVDVVAILSLPAAALPAQSVDVDAGIINNSKLNSASTPVLEVTAATTTLTPVNPTGCVVITNGWRCPLSTLTAGQQVQRTFTALWLGTDNSSMQVDVQVYADQDDYRIANNTISASSDITTLPDPSLASVITSNRDGRASVTVTASNLSPINNVTDAEVILEVPLDLTVTGYPPCTLSGDGRSFICSLGTLPPESDVTLNFDLKGVGTFLLPMTLQSSSGDIHPGDTSKTLAITLKRSSDSGSALPLAALMLLLYRRRNRRSHSSN